MNKEKFNASILELSEVKEDPTILKAKFLICPLDEGNLNKKGLREKDLTEEEIAGLKNKPVVAKVIKNKDGELDFSGHEFKQIYQKDENGKLIKKSVFGTSPIGTHTSVYIEDIEINKIKKRCIVADCVFWTRYEQSTQVLLKLYSEGRLKSSWEIAYDDSYSDKGIIWLKKIYWLGNCVLGKYINPAYKDAGVLEVAEENQEEVEDVELIKAFTQDVAEETQIKSNLKQKEKGDNTSMKKKEVSSLTVQDLNKKIWDSLNPKGWSSSPYYSIVKMYPEEHRIVCYDMDNDKRKDEDYIEVLYTVDEEDNVSIDEKKEVKMTFVQKDKIEQSQQVIVQLDETAKLLSEKETTIKELSTKIENLENEVSEKVDAITKLGETIKTHEETISSKDNAISELTPFKEQIEKAEEEKKQAEIAQKREDLKVLATKGGYITSEELETSEELKKLVEDVDEKGIKAVIAERVIKQLDNTETSTEKIEKAEKNLEVSEEDSLISPTDVMKSFLKSK
ncbi:hypothetical protein [Clostridium botulinum]|uniref:hypothetical protein n=1 Tax=Clostridium botulinum TaxID=1491 RepID=UPI000772FF22|nr:hypothetical protein [Clostridium botulinum]